MSSLHFITLFRLHRLFHQGRRRLLHAPANHRIAGSEELVRSLIEGEALRRRCGGDFCTGAACRGPGRGFWIEDLIGADHVTPGARLLLGVTGLGNLAYHLIERKLK